MPYGAVNNILLLIFLFLLDCHVWEQSYILFKFNEICYDVVKSVVTLVTSEGNHQATTCV